MAYPGWSVNGLGMNDALTPCVIATSLTTNGNVMLLPAMVSAYALGPRGVCVHGRPGVDGERIGHERGAHGLRDRDLLDHVRERHDVVGHGQGVRVAQVDLLLAGAALVVAELDRDAHRLQRLD